MQTTTNVGLKKPSADDFVNVEDLNFNADKIDAELSRKLDKTGGTLTGDLVLGGELKWSEDVKFKAQGNKLIASAPITIYPGDVGVEKQLQATKLQATHAYIAGSITLAGRYTKKTASIPISGWETVSGAYTKRYKLMVSGLKATDYLDVTIDKSSMDSAQKAELCPTIEENEGFAYIYAKRVPEAALSITYKVVV